MRGDRLTPWLLGAAVAAVAGCSPASTPGAPQGHSPAGPSASAPLTPLVGCLNQAQALAVWTAVNGKLDAIELDPKHQGTAQIATGDALTLINQYLQQNLEAARLTEKEVDRLVSLNVVQAACNGAPLVVDVSVTVVRDDYYRSDGSFDHTDPEAGQTLHLRETLVLSAGTWKEAAFVPQTGPQQSPLAL